MPTHEDRTLPARVRLTSWRLGGRRCVVWCAMLVACGGRASAPASFVCGKGMTPRAFEPWAASFTSPSSGFVLGVTHCRTWRSKGCQPRCPALVATTSDGGSVWRQVSAPTTIIAPLLIAGGRGAAGGRIDVRQSPRRLAVRPRPVVDTRTVALTGGASRVNEQDNCVLMSSYAASLGVRPMVYGIKNNCRARCGARWAAMIGSRQRAGGNARPIPLLAASGDLAALDRCASPRPRKPSPAGPVIWRSVDDGAHWTQITPCGTGSLGGITATSPTAVVMACGPPRKS